MESKKSLDKTCRIEALDFLRGSYIILALLQHYGGILNAMGFQASGWIVFLFWLLAPSGEQIFLALAAFNLAKRSRAEFKQVYTSKLITFGLLFLLFFFEPFFRASDLGSALYWGPLLTWMVILSLLATIYRFLGVIGVFVLFLAQMFLWVLPMAEFNNLVESTIQLKLNIPSFYYNAPLDRFIGSGALGFLLGYFFLQKRALWTAYSSVLILSGSLLMLPHLFFSPSYVVNPNNIFENEYQVVSSFIGALSIWGTIAIIITSFLLVETNIKPVKISIINWCGRNSLLIFALHLVLLIRVLIPLRMHFGELLGFAATNMSVEIFIYIFLVLSICYALKAVLLRRLEKKEIQQKQ